MNQVATEEVNLTHHMLLGYEFAATALPANLDPLKYCAAHVTFLHSEEFDDLYVPFSSIKPLEEPVRCCPDYPMEAVVLPCDKYVVLNKMGNVLPEVIEFPDNGFSWFHRNKEMLVHNPNTVEAVYEMLLCQELSPVHMRGTALAPLSSVETSPGPSVYARYIHAQQWFHGHLSEEDADVLLSKEGHTGGEWLMRRSDVNKNLEKRRALSQDVVSDMDLVLSINLEGTQTKHLCVHILESSCQVGTQDFDHIEQMIRQFSTTGVPGDLLHSYKERTEYGLADCILKAHVPRIHDQGPGSAPTYISKPLQEKLCSVDGVMVDATTVLRDVHGRIVSQWNADGLLHRILTCPDIKGISEPLTHGSITPATAHDRMLALVQNDKSTKDGKSKSPEARHLVAELATIINSNIPAGCQDSASKVGTDEEKVALLLDIAQLGYLTSSQIELAPEVLKKQQTSVSLDLADRNHYITVAGAVGAHADIVNGKYYETKESLSNRPQYRKLNDDASAAGAVWLWKEEGGTGWAISDTRARGATDRNQLYCHSVEDISQQPRRAQEDASIPRWQQQLTLVNGTQIKHDTMYPDPTFSSWTSVLGT